MKLIFIYGPPAVGKFTVGHELAKLTGYRLFHNHLTVLVAGAIFPGRHESEPPKAYSKLLRKMRLAALEAAAEADVNTIFTLAYSGAPDDTFVEQIVEKVKKHEGTVHFVQLEAPDEVLLQRVNDPSRKAIAKKITDSVSLKHVLEARDVHATMPHVKPLKINTVELSPAIAAAEIADYFKL